MRGFFLRLALSAGVLFVAAMSASWYYYIYVWAYANEDYYTGFFEGGYRVALADLADGTRTLEELSGRFGYPVVEVGPEALPEPVRLRIDAGEEMVYFWDDAEFFVTPLDDTLIRFGPLPPYPEAREYLLLAGIGVAFALLAGGVLLVLVRPVARELTSMETVAAALADGDWQARVDTSGSRTTRQLARAFNRMADTTSATIGAQRDLLRSVSHELRTPVARLQTDAHILATLDSVDQRQARLASIDRDVEALTELVDELLTYSRLEGGPARAATAEPIDVVAEIGGVLDAGDIELPVELETSSVGPEAWVSIDGASFRRALANLLSNAERHGRGRVTVSVATTDAEVVVAVDDDGPGIPERERERVLEPFFRLESEPGGPGYGLGLAIVRRIVAVSSGRLRILDSELGGCRVELVWPRDRAPGQA